MTATASSAKPSAALAAAPAPWGPGLTLSAFPVHPSDVAAKRAADQRPTWPRLGTSEVWLGTS